MYYIYKTTNIINNKIYIGLHKSNDIMNDTYLGSGKTLSKAIKKYGKENFKREILYQTESVEEASFLESKIVNENFVKDKMTYNLKTGGFYGWMLIPHNKGKISITSPITKKTYYVEEHELQIFLDKGFLKGQNFEGRNCLFKNGMFKYVKDSEIDYFLNNGWKKWNTTKGKICMTNVENMKLIYVEPNQVQYFSDIGYIIGNLLSGVNKGRVYVKKNGKNKRINKEDITEYLNNGWEIGRHQKENKIKRMYNPLTQELKNVPIDKVDNFLKNGWKLGVNYKGNQGRIYITKEKINKRIEKSELEKYIQKGWKKGMFNKKYNNENSN